VSCHHEKYSEAGSVVQVHKVLNDIEILAGCTPAKVGRTLSGPLLCIGGGEQNKLLQRTGWEAAFSALYGMYTVTVNELKAVGAQAKHRVTAKKISSEPTAQDDEFWEVKRRKRYNSNGNSQSAKNSIKSVPKSAAVKLPPKAKSTRNYFAPLRTTDMDTETTGVENTLPEEEAAKKSGRPPPIVMTSTTNLIRLHSYLKEHIKGEYEFRNIRNGTRIIAK
jgi:hypothetical protein